jgi:hypothetical protein
MKITLKGLKMSRDSYRNYVDLAEHYLAIGMTSISLFDWSDAKEFSEKPWEYVTKASVEGEDSMRFSVGNVRCNFEAKHPCGLTFTWSVRPFEDNHLPDDPYPMVNRDAIVLMQQNLTKPLWWSIQAGLRSVAKGMDKHIDDYLTAARNWKVAQESLMFFVVGN